jgi:hypothetical protein
MPGIKSVQILTVQFPALQIGTLRPFIDLLVICSSVHNKNITVMIQQAYTRLRASGTFAESIVITHIILRKTV